MEEVRVHTDEHGVTRKEIRPYNRVRFKKHCDDGPAIIYPNGDKEWWVNGKLHRLEGPAIESNHEKPQWVDQWWCNGMLHRHDGPAIVRWDGMNKWYTWGHPVYMEDVMFEPISRRVHVHEEVVDETDVRDDMSMRESTEEIKHKTIASLSVLELKIYLKLFGLNHRGRKKDLIERAEKCAKNCIRKGEKEEKEEKEETDDETIVYEDNDEEKMCGICYSQPPDVALNPCGHFSFCGGCANQVFRTSKKCPLCRVNISSVLKIHA
jgi:hypothetical protein